MALDQKVIATPSSRRALLAAGLGGLLATLAAALGRAPSVRAADGETVLIGGAYDAESVTKITNLTNTNAVFGAYSGGGTGVHGDSESGYGVSGHSDSSIGMYGSSYGTSQGWGVYGSSSTPTSAAIVGQGNGDSSGVIGYSGLSGLPPAQPRTGVYGRATQSGTAVGVRGESLSGRGVFGQATTGIGVYATATTGTALRADGPVRFKTSGLATIPMGTRSVTVTPGMDMTTSSKVLPSLQGDAGGSTVIQRIAVNATANTFTIYLTANSVRAVKVSWFVIS
jgi:hypothetical protein